MRSRLSRGLLLGVLSGAVTAAVVELTRPRGGRGILVDWEAVRAHAGRRLAASAPLDAAQRSRLEVHYARLAAEMRGPLLAAVGGPADLHAPAFQALGRREWLDVNLEILARVIEPLAAAAEIPDNRLVELGRAGVERYVAFLLSFLATRVLGQFDPQLMGREPVASTALYLVEENVAEWEREAGLPGDDLRRWLILHEMTHAWQFLAHPWLAAHMNSSLEQLLALATTRRGGLGRVAAMTVGLPSQWAVMRQVQATMSLVEGYSNLVMDEAGRGRLESYERLEAAYRRRSGDKNPLEVLFWKVTGLDMKARQYREGEAFCRAVRDAHGIGVLNLAWESEANLPRPSEIGNPHAWVRRVAGRPAGFRESSARETGS